MRPWARAFCNGHLNTVLFDDDAAVLRVAELLARAELPVSAASALGLGRIVALSKPAGGVRGIVGDFLVAHLGAAICLSV